jgi:hypothetical protein
MRRAIRSRSPQDWLDLWSNRQKLIVGHCVWRLQGIEHPSSLKCVPLLEPEEEIEQRLTLRCASRLSHLKVYERYANKCGQSCNKRANVAPCQLGVEVDCEQAVHGTLNLVPLCKNADCRNVWSAKVA